LATPHRRRRVMIRLPSWPQNKFSGQHYQTDQAASSQIRESSHEFGLERHGNYTGLSVICQIAKCDDYHKLVVSRFTALHLINRHTANY